MPVQNSESAIEITKATAIETPKTRKLAKSKKAAEGLTALQAQENQLIIDSAQAGYNSEVYAAAGNAFLQGGQQKFMEVILGGYGAFVAGVGRNVGVYREPQDFDVWATTKTNSEDVDVWV
jgi:hypothetical protein